MPCHPIRPDSNPVCDMLICICMICQYRHRVYWALDRVARVIFLWDCQVVHWCNAACMVRSMYGCFAAGSGPKCGQRVPAAAEAVAIVGVYQRRRHGQQPLPCSSADAPPSSAYIIHCTQLPVPRITPFTRYASTYNSVRY